MPIYTRVQDFSLCSIGSRKKLRIILSGLSYHVTNMKKFLGISIYIAALLCASCGSNANISSSEYVPVTPEVSASFAKEWGIYDDGEDKTLNFDQGMGKELRFDDQGNAVFYRGVKNRIVLNLDLQKGHEIEADYPKDKIDVNVNTNPNSDINHIGYSIHFSSLGSDDAWIRLSINDSKYFLNIHFEDLPEVEPWPLVIDTYSFYPKVTVRNIRGYGSSAYADFTEKAELFHLDALGGETYDAALRGTLFGYLSPGAHPGDAFAGHLDYYSLQKMRLESFEYKSKPTLIESTLSMDKQSLVFEDGTELALDYCDAVKGTKKMAYSRYGTLVNILSLNVGTKLYVSLYDDAIMGVYMSPQLTEEKTVADSSARV